MLTKAMVLAGAVALVSVSGAQASFVVDLTTALASGSANGALYQQIDPQSTGTGVFDPFVRLQQNGTEEGYNTDGSLSQFSATKAGTWTHGLLLSDVPVVEKDGAYYRQFLVDVNQLGSSLLSLDAMQVFLGNAGNLVNYPTFGGNASKVFDMDQGADGDGYVKLKASLNNGSGSGDMAVYVPNSLFTGSNPYVYLYSHFGSVEASNDGFEEWGVGTGGVTPPPPVVPLPAAAAQGLVALSGLGLVGLVRRAVRRVR